MSNPAQSVITAKRRKRIVALCRAEHGMTVPEMSKAIEADHRTVRDDVRKLELLGYLRSVGTKTIMRSRGLKPLSIVEAEVFMTITEKDYPSPDEPQDHPVKVEKPKPEPMPLGARIVRFL